MESGKRTSSAGRVNGEMMMMMPWSMLPLKEEMMMMSHTATAGETTDDNLNELQILATRSNRSLHSILNSILTAVY